MVQWKHVLSLSLSTQKAPVWEITGAEFSKSEMHTADGISIRFPRMTRVRDDKDWKTATNLPQLKVFIRHPADIGRTPSYRFTVRPATIWIPSAPLIG